MNVVVRIPARDDFRFTQAAANTAVGKPLLDRIGDDAHQIGTVRSAYAEGGDLVLTIEIEKLANVEIDLAADAVRAVSLSPRPSYRRD
jgi:hypothetical protein